MVETIQTDREIAEMIAKMRTPPSMNWKPLADDIETLLKTRFRKEELGELARDWASEQGYTLCDGYCHEFCE